MKSANRVFEVPPALSRGFFALLAAALAGWLVGDSFYAFFEPILISVCGLGFWTVLLAFTLLWRLLNHRELQSLREPVLCWLFLVFLSGVFLAGVLSKNEWRVRQAHDFVDTAAVQLDAAKAKGRPFPSQLPMELERQKPQNLSYSSDGDSYDFIFHAPLDFIDGRLYESESHRWSIWHF